MILGIYGAGGLGREVYELVRSLNCDNRRWKRVIFIDDAQDFKTTRTRAPVYSFEDALAYSSGEDMEVCIAVGEPRLRQVLFEKLSDHELNVATLIHPDVSIPDSTVIGRGTIICKLVSITCDVVIGDNVYVHPMACIGHDSVIGDHSVVSSFVDVAGECNVGRNVFLAIGVVMKQGISVGSKSIVGMSSAIHSDIPESVIAMGNPARPMKRNESEKVFK